MNQATNASVMRASNRKLILNLIRLKPISRVELSERTRLTRASITQIVDELIAAGLVEAVSTEARSALGRKRTQLAIRKDARVAFGVNVRRTYCHVGAVDLYGETLREQRLSLAGKGAEQAVEEIARTIREQVLDLGLSPERNLGIGVCTPGPVDYRQGIVLNPPNFEAWHHLPICGMLTERTGFRALLEKDTNARALEEKYFGEALNASNFILVQIDDGVGSGVVIHDLLFRGSRGIGAEIGHASIRFDGPPCSCGGRGCLENYLRIPALLAGSHFESWEELAGADQTPEGAEILERAAEYLATALVNAVNLFDLEKVILTGDVAAAPEPLVIRLNQRLRARALNRVSMGETPVIASRAVSPVRTGAMACLHDLFQDRG